jgi:dimethylglycine dehydrogenase
VEFTVVNGWQRVEFIKPTPNFHVTSSFRFDENYNVVAAEVKAVQTSGGICAVNGFNRFEMTGADVADFLDRMTCSRLPRKAGRLGLTYLLNHDGIVKTEAAIANNPASDWGT